MDAIVPYNNEISAYAYAREEGQRMEEINEKLKEYIPIEFYKDDDANNESVVNDGTNMSMKSVPVSAITKRTSFTKVTGIKQSALPSEKSLRDTAEKRRTD